MLLFLIYIIVGLFDCCTGNRAVDVSITSSDALANWDTHLFTLPRADMAFLAINELNRSAQLLSLMSTALSLGSIIIALFQTRQHRGRVKAQPIEVVSI